ncbi:MAG: rRNA maturation RNase YbeY [Chloroflexi bacterium RBG_13_48_10]|nr:MAG: rRNA maturation RNase YbeY [Chloroflexi bacterium RBG_13_48_10]
MIYLQVKRKVKLPVDKSNILYAAQLTLNLENVERESSMCVVIGDDTLLRKLNHKYRNIDSATDVLSFPSSEHDPDTNSIYLGDVIISLARAEHQATAGGHPLEDELQLLVIHGTLHLLGYDHLGRVDKGKMQAAQDRILNQLGVNLEIKL